MSTEIQWTDETWNPVTGCTKVSPGCAHCYAEGVAERFWATQYSPVSIIEVAQQPVVDTILGPLRITSRPRQFTDVRTHADRLDQPLRWKKPRKVFVNSMSDLFHEDVPDSFIDQVFAVMALAPQHTFQVLTKRADRMLAYSMKHLRPGGSLEELRQAMRELVGSQRMPLRTDWPLPNVWLGVSVENQHFADERIPLLLQTPAAVRFISAEPLLGPVAIREHLMAGKDPGRCASCGKGHGFTRCQNYGGIAPTNKESRCVNFKRANFALDWVIVGGESGAGARPLWVPWVRSIKTQCEAAGVAVFVKQLGADVRDRNDAGFTGDGDPRSWPDIDPDDIEEDLDGSRDGYQGAPVRVHLRNKKGGDMAEWPEDLRVREFPR